MECALLIALGKWAWTQLNFCHSSKVHAIKLFFSQNIQYDFFFFVARIQFEIYSWAFPSLLVLLPTTKNYGHHIGYGERSPVSRLQIAYMQFRSGGPLRRDFINGRREDGNDLLFEYSLHLWRYFQWLKTIRMINDADNILWWANSK